jgi:hypothetical protein
MRTVLALIPTTSLIVGALTGQIQDRPDFSGRWKLSVPKAPDAEFPPSFVVRQTIARTNVRGEPMEPYFKDITVEWEFTGGTRSETYGIGGVGGRVSGIDTRPGAPPQTSFSATHSVRWDGKRLVFETARYERPPAEPRADLYSERVEVWELGADGLLTISVTTRGSKVETTTKSATYVRN